MGKSKIQKQKLKNLVSCHPHLTPLNPPHCIHELDSVFQKTRGIFYYYSGNEAGDINI